MPHSFPLTKAGVPKIKFLKIVPARYQFLIRANHGAEGFEKRAEILVAQTTKGTKVGKTANI